MPYRARRKGIPAADTPRFTCWRAALAASHCETDTVNPQTIKTLIEQGLPGASADVRGDDGVHFEATVISDAFTGKLPLARHRLVYATLGALMGREIHALGIEAKTPAEAGQG